MLRPAQAVSGPADAGPIDAGNAMKLLYGNYDPKAHTSTAGKDLTVTVYASQEGIVNGKRQFFQPFNTRCVHPYRSAQLFGILHSRLHPAACLPQFPLFQDHLVLETVAVSGSSCNWTILQS